MTLLNSHCGKSACDKSVIVVIKCLKLSIRIHILFKRCYFSSQNKNAKGYIWEDFLQQSQGQTDLRLGVLRFPLVLPTWWSSSPTAIHSPPLVNGAAHLTVSGPTVNQPVSSDSVLPRPFRLESLGVPLSNGKVKRKKSKSHIHNEGIWKDLNTCHCHLFLT